MNITDESWLPSPDELDTLNVLCTLTIFAANIISVLYILWSVTPLIKSSLHSTVSQVEHSLSISTSPIGANISSSITTKTATRSNSDRSH